MRRARRKPAKLRDLIVREAAAIAATCECVQRLIQLRFGPLKVVYEMERQMTRESVGD